MWLARETRCVRLGEERKLCDGVSRGGVRVHYTLYTPISYRVFNIVIYTRSVRVYIGTGRTRINYYCFQYISRI